jgi:hypothetical protein
VSAPWFSSLEHTTLAALDTTVDRVVVLHDYVRAGDVVPVYRTFEAAAEERGPRRMMRVVKREDDWLLEPAETT